MTRAPDVEERALRLSRRARGEPRALAQIAARDHQNDEREDADEVDALPRVEPRDDERQGDVRPDEPKRNGCQTMPPRPLAGDAR